MILTFIQQPNYSQRLDWHGVALRAGEDAFADEVTKAIGVVMQSVFTVFCSVARWLSVGEHEHRFIVRQNWGLLDKSVGCGSFEPRCSAS